MLNGNASVLGSMVVAGDQINVDVSSGNFESLYSTRSIKPDSGIN